MDTRDYDEVFDRCVCAADDKCGCSFPQNVKNFTTDCQDCDCEGVQNCGCLNEEFAKTAAADEPIESRLEKESICTCSQDSCDCTATYTQSDN